MNNAQSPLDLYAPPKSSTVVTPPYQLSFLGVDGRIGRLRYIAWLTGGFITITGGYFLLLWLFFRFVRYDFIYFSGLSTLVSILGLVYFILLTLFVARCTMQRLQDFNVTRWLALLLIIPLLNILLVFIFMLIPGNADDNKYGPPPPANSKTVIVFASIFLFIAGSLFIRFTLL